MHFGLIEIAGVFLVVVGCGTIVGAAALVSTALAVLAAGVFLVLFGIVAVYVAATLEQAQKPAKARTDGQP